MAKYAQEPNVLSFARALLAAGDLDPIYEMLHKAALSPSQISRWCLAYWWFYNAGVATELSQYDDGAQFYGEALRQYPTFPRGAERRHFRGDKGRKAIEWFSKEFEHPDWAIDSITAQTFKGVSAQVQKWPQFGPWIAFKVADMLERVLARQISFKDCELLMYDEPRKGGELVAAEHGFGQGPEAVRLAIEYIQDAMFAAKAPPANDRPLGLQEIETILCKFKSHRNGHYPVGKDRLEIKHCLLNYSKENALCARLGRLL